MNPVVTRAVTSMTAPVKSAARGCLRSSSTTITAMVAMVFATVAVSSSIQRSVSTSHS